MIALPDNNRRPPVLGGTEGSSDLLAGGITPDHTDREAVAVAVEAAAIAVCLAVQTVETGRQITDGVPPESFTVAEHRAVWAGVLAAVAYGQPPHPVAVAVAIERAGIELPPTWRGSLQSRLWELAADPPPIALAPWLLDQVHEQNVRRRIAHLGRGIESLSGRGEFPDMAAAVRREAAAVLALLAEAVNTHA